MAADSGIIIVTGSNGRIGDAVMRRFAGRFTDVIGFDRKAPKPPPPGCVYIPVEITSDEGVREGLRTIRDHHGAHVAAVIHLAAYYDFFGRPSPMYEEVTVRGTGRLLRGLRALGFHVEQFVFSSTMLVHRPGEPGEFITEDWPLEPTWAYPESKVRTEQLIRAERGDVPAVLLRISGVYDDLCHSIPLAHQIQRIHERDLTSRLYSGSTAHGQAFMHMDDLVDAIERVVERRAGLSPEIPILLGEPEALSYDELQHTIARLLRGSSKETIEIPSQLSPLAKAGAWVLDHVPGQEAFIKPWMIDRANDHYALDITRARTVLGWEPKRSLRRTLPQMIAALQADPVRWYRENDLELPSALAKEAEERERQAGRAAEPHGGQASRPPSRATMRATRPRRHPCRHPRRRTGRTRRRPRRATARWRWRTTSGRTGHTSPTWRSASGSSRARSPWACAARCSRRATWRAGCWSSCSQRSPSRAARSGASGHRGRTRWSASGCSSRPSSSGRPPPRATPTTRSRARW